MKPDIVSYSSPSHWCRLAVNIFLTKMSPFSWNAWCAQRWPKARFISFHFFCTRVGLGSLCGEKDEKLFPWVELPYGSFNFHEFSAGDKFRNSRISRKIIIIMASASYHHKWPIGILLWALTTASIKTQQQCIS